MQDDILSRSFRVTDPRVASVFGDAFRNHLVLLATRQERSIAELAEITGVELKRTHYHVTALQKLGLLVVAREQQRAGRAIKMYRAIAESFFVSAAVSSVGSTDALMVQLRESLAKQRDLSMQGVVYYLDESGKKCMRAVKNPTSQQISAGESWRILPLSREQARALARDIEACIDAHVHRASGKGQTYLVHFSYAPTLDE